MICVDIVTPKIRSTIDIVTSSHFFPVYTTVIFDFIYEHEICFNLCICSYLQDTVHF